MMQATILQIDADLENLAKVRQFVRHAAVEYTHDTEAVAELILAVNEAVTNVIVHGYQNPQGCITVVVTFVDNTLTVLLRDSAPYFDPTTVPAPDTKRPLSQRPFGGMGIYMMRTLTDEMRYQRTAAGENELTLSKRVRNS